MRRKVQTMIAVGLTAALFISSGYSGTSASAGSTGGTEVNQSDTGTAGIHVATEYKNKSIVVLIGDRAYSVRTDADGAFILKTNTADGLFYVQYEQSSTKYYFSNGTIVNEEVLEEPMGGVTGCSELTPGDTLDLSIAPVPNAEYQWSKNGTPITGATSYNLTKGDVQRDDTGEYQVDVISKNGSITTKRRKVSVDQKEQTIKGPTFYNVFRQRGAVTLNLTNSAETDVSYSIVEDNDCGAELDSEKGTVTFRTSGELLLQATAAESDRYKKATTYISISCNDRSYENSIKNNVYTYNGNEQPYNYEMITGITSCNFAYLNCNGSSSKYSYSAPKLPGKYNVRLILKAADGAEVIKFAAIEIKKKTVSISGLGVKTKEYDGSLYAELKGTLTGIAPKDSVRLVFPSIKYKSASAGKNKPIKVTSGSLLLSGVDADLYNLKSYNVKGLKGTILKKSVTIKALNKTGYVGQPLDTLEYYVSGNVTGLKGIKLKCSATANSKPGKYKITVTSSKNKNYSIKYKSGTYTLKASLDSRTTPKPEPDYSEPEPTPAYYEPEPTPSSTAEPSVSNVVEDLDNDAGEDDTDSATDTLSTGEVNYARVLASALAFDGTFEIDSKSLDSETDVLYVKYWLTNNAQIRSNDSNVVFKYGKSGWCESLALNVGKSEQCVITNGMGTCYTADDLTLTAKVNDKKCKVVIQSLICDKEQPLIEVAGVNTTDDTVTNAPATLTQNQAIQISVNATFGISGRKVLAYKLISSASDVTDSEDGWCPVTGTSIVINHDFEGQVAIRAKDALENSSTVYTEKMKIDASAPKVDGIVTGGVYDGKAEFNVTDQSGVKSVTLDGKPCKSAGIVNGGGLHTLIATDVNGNKRSVTFTCKDTNFIMEIIHSIF